VLRRLGQVLRDEREDLFDDGVKVEALGLDRVVEAPERGRGRARREIRELEDLPAREVEARERRDKGGDALARDVGRAAVDERGVGLRGEGRER
jgi:hypothetical protein